MKKNSLTPSLFFFFFSCSPSGKLMATNDPATALIFDSFSSFSLLRVNKGSRQRQTRRLSFNSTFITLHSLTLASQSWNHVVSFSDNNNVVSFYVLPTLTLAPPCNETSSSSSSAFGLGASKKKGWRKINETQKLKEKGREWREKAINQRINFHFLLSSLRLFSVHWLACRRWERSLGTLTLRRCAECRGSQRAMSWWGAKNLENYTEMLLMGSFEEEREREHRYCWGGWVEGRIFDMPAGAHVVINNKSVPKRFVMEASRQQGVRCQQRTTKLCYWKLIKWFSYPFFHRCWSLLDCVPPNALSLSLLDALMLLYCENFSTVSNWIKAKRKASKRDQLEGKREKFCWCWSWRFNEIELWREFDYTIIECGKGALGSWADDDDEREILKHRQAVSGRTQKRFSIFSPFFINH